MQISDERKQFLDYLDYSLYSMWTEIYVRKGSAIDRFMDLADKKIAMVDKDNNALGFLKSIKKLEIKIIPIWYNSHDKAIKALISGEVY